MQLNLNSNEWIVLLALLEKQHTSNIIGGDARHLNVIRLRMRDNILAMILESEQHKLERWAKKQNEKLELIAKDECEEQNVERVSIDPITMTKKDVERVDTSVHPPPPVMPDPGDLYCQSRRKVNFKKRYRG